MTGITGSIVLPIVSPPVNPPVGGRKPHKTSKKVKPPPVLDSMTVWATVRDASTITDASGVPITATDGASFDRLYVRPESSLAGAYFGPFQNLAGANTHTYNTNVNGFPALTCPSQTIAALKTAAGAIERGGVTSDVCTMFMVASYTEANNWRPILKTAEYNRTSNFLNLIYDTRTQKRAIFGVGNSSGAISGFGDMLARDTGLGPRLIAGQSEGAGGNATGWKDGVKQVSGALAATPQSFYNGTYTQLVMGIGGSAQSGGWYFHEIIVYNALMSDADVGLVSDYLTAVYGL